MLVNGDMEAIGTETDADGFKTVEDELDASTTNK